MGGSPHSAGGYGSSCAFCDDDTYRQLHHSHANGRQRGWLKCPRKDHAACFRYTTIDLWPSLEQACAQGQLSPEQLLHLGALKKQNLQTEASASGPQQQGQEAGQVDAHLGDPIVDDSGAGLSSGGRERPELDESEEGRAKRQRLVVARHAELQAAAAAAAEQATQQKLQQEAVLEAEARALGINLDGSPLGASPDSGMAGATERPAGS